MMARGTSSEPTLRVTLRLIPVATQTQSIATDQLPTGLIPFYCQSTPVPVQHMGPTFSLSEHQVPLSGEEASGYTADAAVQTRGRSDVYV
jgi:hypothetical protein